MNWLSPRGVEGGGYICARSAEMHSVPSAVASVHYYSSEFCVLPVVLYTLSWERLASWTAVGDNVCWLFVFHSKIKTPPMYARNCAVCPPRQQKAPIDCCAERKL